MAEKKLYVVQLKKWKRWIRTNWTRRGVPVRKPSAEKALARAMAQFPKSEYRIAECRLKS